MNGVAKDWVVYEARSKSEGKVYIGRTQNLRHRQKVHRSYAKHRREQSLFYQALRRLGWDGFTWRVLQGGMAKEEAIELENKLIESLSTQQKYNMILQGGSQSLKGVTGAEHPAYGLRPANAKWVKCVETKGVFPSSIAAGVEMEISPSSIRKVCKGVHQQAKGYTFVYLKGGDLPCS